MAQEFTVSTAESGDISETDILFECGQCGKSLVIDRRGAGLSINCPDCDAELKVPIPEGVDLEEIDRGISEAALASASESEDYLVLDELPPEVRDRVGNLVTEVQELRTRCACLDRLHDEHGQWMNAIMSQLTVMRTALEQIEDSLENMSDKAAADTQTME